MDFPLFQVHLCIMHLGLFLPYLVLFFLYDLLSTGVSRTLSNTQDGYL